MDEALIQKIREDKWTPSDDFNEYPIDWVTLKVLAQEQGYTDDWGEMVQTMIHFVMSLEKPGEMNSLHKIQYEMYRTCTCGAISHHFWVLRYDELQEAWQFIIWASEHCFIGREYDDKAWRKLKYGEKAVS